MKKGVVFTMDDGGTELHRIFAPDWVLITAAFPDGEGSLLETYHGLYLHSSTPIDKGVPQLGDKEVYSGRADIGQWKAPVPGQVWENDTATGGVAGSGDLEKITLGTCSYDAFKVRLKFKDDPKYQETYEYLPELGVGLLVSSTLDGDKETYNYVGVAAAK